MKLKNSKKIILITMALFVFMIVYKHLINLCLPRLNSDVKTIIRKALQAITIILYVTKLKWWHNIGSLKRISLKSLHLLLPVILLSVIPLVNGIKQKSASGIILLIGTSLLIGIIEEFYFRGVIFFALKPEGKKSAILISSMLFGIVHLLNLTGGADIIDTLFQMVFAFGIGLIMAVVRYETDLLLPQILVHALWDFNFSMAKTDFSLMLDTIHSISILLVIVWGIYLTYKALKRKEIKDIFEQSIRIE